MSAIATTISSENRAAWLIERRKGLGASDMPAVLGVDAFRCALDVYLDKRGMTADREMNEAQEAGLELEAPVLNWYAKRHKLQVTHNTRIYRSSIHPWLACTPDGLLANGDSVQVKCSGRTSAYDDGIPDYVYVQVQSEMLCLERPSSVALALVSGWGGFSLKPYEVGRDEELIERIERSGADMMRRIREGDPPDPDGSRAAANAIKRLYPADSIGDEIVLGIEACEITDRLQEVEKKLKLLGAERDLLRQQIQMQMGAHALAILPGGGSWSWKTQHRSGYTVEPTSARTLRFIKPKKAKGDLL